MERDFLFGVLAVQLGFVAPSELMAAASAWLGDRSRSIQDRLVADGILDAERRDLLNALVTETLKQSAGDARKAVETLGGDDAVRRSFGGALRVDIAVPGTLQAGAAPREQSGVPFAETIALVSDSGSRPDTTDPGIDTSQVTSEHPGRYRHRGATRVDAELGRGGLGRVYLAFDRHVGREVAVKELLDHGMSSLDQGVGSGGSAMVARFLREARVTGQLEHPNIVPVYELGQRPDGTFYYTMRVVRGKTLGDKLKRCRTAADRLGLLDHYVNLCNAIAYAHSRGVIHRDIKPDNVMVGEFGETVVLDWGIAKVHGKKDIRGDELARELAQINDQNNDRTLDGSAIGTPAYMSPEQAEGRIGDIDERSDVWGLGAVLYEILTGKPPFQALTPLQILVQVRRDRVAPVRTRSPEAPAELAAVAEKALQRDRELRYPTAKELSLEVESFLHGSRVGAYSYSSWELLRRFFARNMVLSLGVLAVLLTVVASSIAIFLAWGREQKARAAAEDQRRQAEAKEREATANLTQAYINKVEQLIRARSYSLAHVYAAAALRESQRADHPLSPVQHVALDSALYESGVRRGLVLQRAVLLPGRQTSVDFSPDGASLAASSDDWSVSLVPVDGSRPPITRKLSIAAGQVRFAPDGSALLAAGCDGVVRMLDPVDLHDLRKETVYPGLCSSTFFFSPDRKMLVLTAHADDTTWLVPLGAPRSRISLGKSYWVDFSPDGGQVACVTGAGSVELRDTSSGKVLSTLEVPDTSIDGATYSPDGKRLLVRAGKELIVLDIQKRAPVARLGGLSEFTEMMRFSPNGRSVYVATSKGMSVWDGRDAVVAEQVWEESGSWDVAVSRDGARVAVSGDGVVTVWQVRKEAHALRSESTRPMQLSWSPDGRTAAVAEYGGALSLVDPESGRKTLLGNHLETATGVFGFTAFSPDGSLLASIGHDMALHVFRTEPPTLLRSKTLVDVKWEYGGGPALSWSPDGARIAVSLTDGRIRLVAADTLATERFLDGALFHPMPVRFSPDGKWLAGGDMFGKIAWWEAKGWRLYRALETPRGTLVSDLIFAVDGKTLLTAGDDGWVSRWDVESGALVGDWRAHDAWVNRLSLSKDGKLLLTGSDDGTAKVWDASTGELRRVLRFQGEVAAAAFSPDGRWLAAGWERGVDFLPVLQDTTAADGDALVTRAVAEAGRVLEGFVGRPSVAPQPEPARAQTAPPQGLVRASVVSWGGNVVGAPPGATLELLQADNHEPFSPPLAQTVQADGTVLFKLPPGTDRFAGRLAAGGVVTYGLPLAVPGHSGTVHFGYVPRSYVEVRATLAGVKLDPAKGSVTARVLWGDAHAKAGVGCAEVAEQTGARVYFPQDITPDLDPSLRATTFSGDAIVFNLDPGVHQLTARVDGRSEQVSVVVHAASVTTAAILFPAARYPANPTPSKCLEDWPRAVKQ